MESRHISGSWQERETIMRGAKMLACLIALAALVAAGCSSGVSASEEKRIIDKAKTDFASEDMGGMYFGEYGSRSVTGAKLFDHVDLPEGDAIWAVELDFTAVEKATGAQKTGIALLQYMRVHSKTGDEKDYTQKEEVMFFLVGFTESEIESNRTAVKASINSVKAMKEMTGM
jgi:hypothetical protein